MKKIQTLLFRLLALLMPAFFLLSPKPVSAAACDLTNASSLPTTIFVPWYKYLKGDDASGKCTPDFDTDNSGRNWVQIVSLIGMAILELLLRLSGLIAVGFMIWGGIQYTVSQGEPDGLKHAKDTLTNAIVGFIIVIFSVVIINFVGNAIG